MVYTSWQDEYVAGKETVDHRSEFDTKLLQAAFPEAPYQPPRRTDGGGEYQPTTIEYDDEDEMFDNPIPGIPNVTPLDA